jgi:hypothetical protein
MNLLNISFTLLQGAIFIAAVIFGIRALSQSVSAFRDSSSAPKCLSPSFISAQVLLAAGFVARLTNMLLKRPTGAFEILEIAILFIAIEITLIVLAIAYWKSCRRFQDK